MGPTCLGESCCANITIPTTTYALGRGDAGADTFPSGAPLEQPEHPATVSSFVLDKYEVTVGRFRAFVAGYAGPPAANAGKHPKIPFSGWDPAWNASMPTTSGELAGSLKCGAEFTTWTDAPGAGDDRPINCVSWYEAMAFCAWDGGRLPTEAEWECAAAGGEENRLYPWGGATPALNLAVYGGLFDGVTTGTPGDIPAVGSTSFGAGRWGHQDLAGSMYEWVLDLRDWYPAGGGACMDCAFVLGTGARVARGGSWNFSSDELRAAWRAGTTPDSRTHYYGFRCARDP